MRSLRSELASVATVLAIPVVLVAAFPYGVFGFSATKVPVRSASSVAFVTLNESQTAAAMKAAKSPWQNPVGHARSLRAELRLGELPESVATSVLAVESRGRIAAPKPQTYGFSGYQPSLAAGNREKLSSDPGAQNMLPFPREELLKIE